MTEDVMASLSITNSQSPLRLTSIESVMPSSHLILCRPLLLPSIFRSIRVFSNESALCIRWPTYWRFSFNINPSNEHPGLISYRMDCLDLLAVQGTLKSLLQHHSSKSSIPMIPSGSLDPLSALLESLLSLMVLLSSRLASDDPRKLSGNTVNSNFCNGKPQLTP